ncbi:MAG TPA: hypothetical protein VMD56_02695 [Steroidobacteraceae bacterium]|nr:hypothetical protein [Steroidobacteraceae bacterium]
MALAAGVYTGLLVWAAPPAHAQTDIQGTYNSLDAVDYRSMLLGPRAVDFLGIPLNAEGRAGGLAYSQDTVSVPGHQCESWGPQYLVEAGFNIRVEPTFDDTGYVQAWTFSAWNDYNPLIVWMDGRKAPDPNGVRRAGGFTVGHWEGDTLQTMTTQVKDGVLTRNGVPASDRESMLLWITRHDDLLTITGIIQDPDYLAEPWVQAREFIYTHNPPDAGLHYQYPCMQVDEVPELGRGVVPFFLPGRNPDRNDMMTRFHIPEDAAQGDPAAMYPEYRDRIRSQYVTPGKCTLDCCGWGDFRATGNPRMQCKDEGL